MVDRRSGSGGGGAGGDGSASSAAAGAAITPGDVGSRSRTTSDDERGGRMLQPRTQLALVTGAAIAAAVLLLRGPRPSLNERLKQAAHGRAEAGRGGVGQRERDGVEEGVRGESTGGADTSYGSAGLNGGGEGARRDGEAGAKGEAEREEDRMRAEARQRTADEELRRQQDKFRRAFHRYQHASRTQHTFNWYWDGRSFGHGWDEPPGVTAFQKQRSRNQDNQERAAVNFRRVLTAYEFLSSRGKQAARR
ncbi:unnamed protein product [Closterium sp. NIES-64]|nr:unnamed protein product [Closterium sp. NIES-64]